LRGGKRTQMAMARNPPTALLIYPPTGLYRRDHRCQNRVCDQTVQVVMPPIDLAYMASFLREAGLESTIIDYPAQGRGLEDFKNDIGKPIRFLVLKTTSSTFLKDMEICRLARSLREDLKIILFEAPAPNGRSQADVSGVFDGLVHGESELPDMIASLSPPGEVACVEADLHEDSNTYSTPGSHRRDFLDYPFPARDLLQIELYRLPVSNEPMTVIHAARGCPHKCIFCPAPSLYGGVVRQRPVDSVMEEIGHCVDRFGARFILFDAETFTLDRIWVMALCDQIFAQGQRFSWGANSRVDTVDSEMLIRMKQAGCRILGFGVESGDESMLSKMKKSIHIPQIKRAFRECSEAGILTHAFFVMGLPWENQATLARTLSLAKELKPDLFDFNIVLPLPGSEYEVIAKKENLIVRTLDGAGYSDSPVRSFHLSHDELVKARRRMLLRLYLSPEYLLRTVRREAISFGRFYRLIVYGLRRLAALAGAQG